MNPTVGSGVESSSKPDDSAPDGRELRRTRNREAVLDTVVDMFRDGVLEPSTDDVAERAGVSVRSVYRYFESRDRLLRAALEYLLQPVILQLAAPPSMDGSLPERLDRFTEWRLGLYFDCGDVVRLARRVGRDDPTVTRTFTEALETLAAQIAGMFGPELDRFDGGERIRRRIGMSIPLHFDSLEHLHLGCGVERPELHAMLRRHLLVNLMAADSTSIE